MRRFLGNLSLFTFPMSRKFSIPTKLKLTRFPASSLTYRRANTFPSLVLQAAASQRCYRSSASMLKRIVVASSTTKPGLESPVVRRARSRPRSQLPSPASSGLATHRWLKRLGTAADHHGARPADASVTDAGSIGSGHRANACPNQLSGRSSMAMPGGPRARSGMTHFRLTSTSHGQPGFN